MIRMTVIAAFAFSLPNALSGQRIERKGGDAVLQLPPAMADALRSHDSTFSHRRLSDYSPWHYDPPCDRPPACPTAWYRITERQALFAVVGDFNGDSILDLVVDGDNHVEGLRLAVLSDGAGFRVERLGQLEPISATVRQFRERPRQRNDADFGVAVGLEVWGPGKLKSEFEEEALVLTTDAFIAHTFEKAGSLYYYRAGKWHRYSVID